MTRTALLECMQSVETLDWDSSFFGIKVGRVCIRRPTASQLARAVEEAGRQEIECLYWLADSGDPVAPQAASQCGFRLVDVRVTLEHDLSAIAEKPDPALPTVRFFRPEDLSKLLQIAVLSHRDSRFFQDGNFAAEKCADLYEEWLRKACAASSGAVLVAEVEGQPGGYCICATTPEGNGSISLIAVDSHHRRARAGTALVLGALDYFKQSGAPLATVVTQGRNVASQRLYQKCGFITRSVHLWYHRWRSEVG